ncbi:MAG: TrbC/VirB2 family protein [Wolbachia endosymbiont of Fragariocoptes setiger]|nr:TrbC/VirB2 family protein [Wolbachia endosymbiont of Fragariocoptes setiger]
MTRKIPTFLILLFSIFLYTAEVNAKGENKNNTNTVDDATYDTICNIIKYIWTIGGPLMTVVIIGAALLAIFGKMLWPALVALGVFCAVFFGATTIVKQLVPSTIKGPDGKDVDLNNCGK